MLAQVSGHARLDGSPQHRFIFVAGQDHHLGLWQHLFDPGSRLHSGAIRHVDVQQENIRLKRISHLDGLTSTVALADHLDVGLHR
jgi:hypothetical protein